MNDDHQKEQQQHANCNNNTMDSNYGSMCVQEVLNTSNLSLSAMSGGCKSVCSDPDEDMVYSIDSNIVNEKRCIEKSPLSLSKGLCSSLLNNL